MELEEPEVVDAEIIATEPPSPNLDEAERSVLQAFGKPFAPGQSGNPKGRPPKRLHLPSMLADKLDAPCKADARKAASEGRPVRTNLEVLVDTLMKISRRELLKGNEKPLRMLLETAGYNTRAPKELVHSGQVDHTGTVQHEHLHKSDDLFDQFKGQLNRLREAQKQLPERIA